MQIPRSSCIGCGEIKIVVLGLVLSGMTGCAHQQPPMANVEQSEWASPAGGKGVELLTEHFDLRVTAKDEELRAVLPTFMEDAYAAYEKLGVGAEAGVTTEPAGEEGVVTTQVADLEERGGEGESGREGEGERGRLGGLERGDVDSAKRMDRSATSQPALRLIVYLFDQRVEWAAFTKGAFPGNAETYLHILSGGYTDQQSATAVAFDLHRDHTLSLLAHEGLHQYLARHLNREIPAWVNEGLATQFEGFELDMVEGGHAHFTPARNYLRKHDLREMMGRDGTLIPLADLLAMDAGQAIRGVRFGSQMYYAQIWSFVLFLRQGPNPVAYHAGFSQLMEDLGTERMTAAIEAERAESGSDAKVSEGELLFRHYITKDLKQAEAEYREFAQALVR